MYRYTDKRGVKHYFGEKCILRGIKTTIFYIKVYENRCASVQVPLTLFATGSYGVTLYHRVNIIPFVNFLCKKGLTARWFV